MTKTRRRGCGAPRHHTIRALALRCSLLRSAVDLLHSGCCARLISTSPWAQVLPSSGLEGIDSYEWKELIVMDLTLDHTDCVMITMLM